MNQHIPASLRRKLQSMIISMIKGILLTSKEDLASENFTAGAPYRTFQPFGIAIHWWLTDESLESRNALAEHLAGFDAKNLVDRETCTEIIRSTLHEICLNKGFFLSDLILSKKEKNLFQCLSIPADKFVDALLSVLRSRIAIETQDRLTLTAIMPRLISQSFFIEHEGVGLINRNERDHWDRICFQTHYCKSWNIEKGSFDQERNYFGSSKFSCYGVSIDQGSHPVCTERAYTKLQMLTTVILCQHISKHQFFFSTVIADPPDGYIQFNSETFGYTASGREPLLPYFAFELKLDTEAINKIREWYEDFSLLDESSSNRIRISAHFANLGINSKSLNSFTFFFIALDALFGVRHRVEESIKNGVGLHLSDQVEKAAWLFDLRNEIVHGGCRSIAEWKKADRYRRHFKSDPLDDIRKIVLQCIWHYPNYSN